MPSRMAYSSATRLFRRLAAEEEQEASHRRSPSVAQRTITRRDFLRGAGAVAAGMAAAPVLGPLAVRSAPARDTRVIVIGAGVAGLRCAHRLRHSGITAQLYEAANRIGGRTFSVTDFFAVGRWPSTAASSFPRSTARPATWRAAWDCGWRSSTAGNCRAARRSTGSTKSSTPTAKRAPTGWSRGRRSRTSCTPHHGRRTSIPLRQRGRELDHISVPDWFDPGTSAQQPDPRRFRTALALRETDADERDQRVRRKSRNSARPEPLVPAGVESATLALAFAGDR